MATVIGDNLNIKLEFTSFELDLMREIAFNTGKTLDQVAAERLQQGVVCEQPGEQDEFEVRYTPENTQQTEAPQVHIEEFDGITAKEDTFRDRINEILTELYNVAWSRGTYANNVLDEKARRLHVALRVDMIMQEVYGYEP